ncbi:aldo/keto reductase [Schlesneria sp. DSM 10557]|uniref:aldo/keto reductase n=1 Tax=Schlesneria sp. DSM 10557 TaxID=3044399 RepID=UPI0035A034EB
MMNSTWKNISLSRLMLGTVQFGLPYGVANRTGQPDYRDVLKILTAAIEGGVNCFDTAAAYGNSEEILGRALRELKVTDRVTVVTKFKPLTPEELADPALARAALEASVESSRQRLQLDCLPIVLFHRETDAVHRPALESLQESGKLRYVGVSCAHFPGPPHSYVESGLMSALQLPANLLDRRHESSGIFRDAAAREVAVFIRSAFLQGLLVMPERDIPAELQAVIPARRRLEQLSRGAGIDLAELALRYLLSQDAVTSVLVGVETVEQVEENLARFERGPLPPDLFNAIQSESFDLPELIVTPGMWSPR